MEKALVRYLRWHRATGHTAKTAQYYQENIGAFISFLNSRGHPTALDELHVDYVWEWLEHQRDKGLSDHTIASRARAIKCFTSWLVEEEWLDRDPLRKFKIPKAADKPKDVLSPADVDKLLAACSKDTVIGLRDRAIILTLYSTGIRASELLSLQLSNLDYERGLILIQRGKGGKFRMVPLGSKVDKAIDRYLALRPEPENVSTIYLTDDGQPMNTVTLRQMLTRRAAKTGIHAHPHLFRHSFAIQYLRQGGRLETLKAILGHSSFELTLHYARLAGVDLAAAHDKADPTQSLKEPVKGKNKALFTGTK